MRSKTPQHGKQVKDRALQLYFEIEKHFALGGSALSLRDITQMLGMPSSASAQLYINLLKRWGLIMHEPKSVRTIVLAQRDYPPVVYGTPAAHSEPLKFARK